jgi:membrane associated rhomboid family serine protease
MPYRSNDPFTSLRGNIARSGAPITAMLVATCVILFLVDYFSRGMVTGLLGCRISAVVDRVGRIEMIPVPYWGLGTYFVTSGDIINLAFSAMWLWWVGSSLERSWGSAQYTAFALGAVLLTSLSVWLGCVVTHIGYTLGGLWLPLSALTVAWAMINPREIVRFYFVLQIPAWVLAIIEVVIVYFIYFGGQPILGLFGLIPSGVAYLIVQNGLMSGRSFTSARRSGPDLRMVGGRPGGLDGSGGRGPLAWFRAWKERRRLRKLWRESGFSDRDNRR